MLVSALSIPKAFPQAGSPSSQTTLTDDKLAIRFLSTKSTALAQQFFWRHYCVWDRSVIINAIKTKTRNTV